ncbi:hypothetical protein [Burkholderia lata]|uniref:hypothetical protein n=1 Tax=Burkholderia lata (strain ATCC 17760 / DSM 23089 / LMG 22485 / NCIMB 9086 / R18194 / 383) TaxID=482957 RepID=UPI0015830964|nr:hypothetical protein [Burkholderia lata]
MTENNSPEKVCEALAVGNPATIVGETADGRDFATRIEATQWHSPITDASTIQRHDERMRQDLLSQKLTQCSIQDAAD